MRSLGRSDETTRDDALYELIARSVAVEHEVEFCGSDPSVFWMLVELQSRVGKVALDRDEIVGFHSVSAIVTNPVLLAELCKDGVETPSGLLLELSRECLLQRLAGFDVTPRHVPTVWEEPTVGGTADNERAAVIDDHRTDDKSWLIHATQSRASREAKQRAKPH